MFRCGVFSEKFRTNEVAGSYRDDETRGEAPLVE